MPYVSIGDPFIEQARKIRQEENLERKKVPADQPPFKDQNKWMLSQKLPFEYVELQENKKGRVQLKLNEMGKPPTEDPNVKVGKNIDYIYKMRPHMKDEYSRPKDQLKQDRLRHKAAMGENPNFRTWDNVKKPFVSDRLTFGQNGPLPQGKTYSFTPKNVHPHDAPFRYPNPAKKGFNKTINKFPTYKEDPYPVAKRKPPMDPSLKKDPFKLTNPGLKSKPSPSVSSNHMNLRRVMTTMSSSKY